MLPLCCMYAGATTPQQHIIRKKKQQQQVQATPVTSQIGCSEVLPQFRSSLLGLSFGASSSQERKKQQRIYSNYTHSRATVHTFATRAAHRKVSELCAHGCSISRVEFSGNMPGVFFIACRRTLNLAAHAAVVVVVVNAVLRFAALR